MFTEEDTAAAIALAEEERDTCPSCGMPKVWCRDKQNGRAMFEAAEDFCWATYYTALRQEKLRAEAHDATFRATQVSARFREGREPEIDAGLELGLAPDGSGGDQHAEDR